MHPLVRKLVDDCFSGENPLKAGYSKILPTLVEDVDLAKALGIIENALLSHTIICSVVDESDNSWFHGFQMKSSDGFFDVILRLSYNTRCIWVEVHFNKTLLLAINKSDIYEEDYKVLKELLEYTELVFRAPEFLERKRGEEKANRELGLEIWEELEV